MNSLSKCTRQSGHVNPSFVTYFEQSMHMTCLHGSRHGCTQRVRHTGHSISSFRPDTPFVLTPGAFAAGFVVVVFAAGLGWTPLALGETPLALLAAGLGETPLALVAVDFTFDFAVLVLSTIIFRFV